MLSHHLAEREREIHRRRRMKSSKNSGDRKAPLRELAALQSHAECCHSNNDWLLQFDGRGGGGVVRGKKERV